MKLKKAHKGEEFEDLDMISKRLPKLDKDVKRTKDKGKKPPVIEVIGGEDFEQNVEEKKQGDKENKKQGDNEEKKDGESKMEEEVESSAQDYSAE